MTAWGCQKFATGRLAEREEPGTNPLRFPAAHIVRNLRGPSKPRRGALCPQTQAIMTRSGAGNLRSINETRRGLVCLPAQAALRTVE
jgi:hypothetical protein